MPTLVGGSHGPHEEVLGYVVCGMGAYVVRLLTFGWTFCCADMLSKSVVHAPNLKRMNLTLRNAHKSNYIGRYVAY